MKWEDHEWHQGIKITKKKKKKKKPQTGQLEEI
jgi:hypothetical protein